MGQKRLSTLFPFSALLKGEYIVSTLLEKGEKRREGEKERGREENGGERCRGELVFFALLPQRGEKGKGRGERK